MFVSMLLRIQTMVLTILVQFVFSTKVSMPGLQRHSDALLDLVVGSIDMLLSVFVVVLSKVGSGCLDRLSKARSSCVVYWYAFEFIGSRAFKCCWVFGSGFMPRQGIQSLKNT